MRVRQRERRDRECRLLWLLVNEFTGIAQRTRASFNVRLAKTMGLKMVSEDENLTGANPFHVHFCC